ncbi:hypothetical protein Dimus_012297 [Dionaea muscipula]
MGNVHSFMQEAENNERSDTTPTGWDPENFMHSSRQLASTSVSKGASWASTWHKVSRVGDSKQHTFTMNSRRMQQWNGHSPKSTEAVKQIERLKERERKRMEPESQTSLPPSNAAAHAVVIIHSPIVEFVAPAVDTANLKMANL